MNKKLLEVTTWFKETKCHEDSEEDKLIVDFLRSTDSAWKHFRDREKFGNNEIRKRKRKAKKPSTDNNNTSNKIQTISFVQHTQYGWLKE